MSTYLPHRRATLAIGGLLLIDLPFLIVVLVAGIHWGFRDVFVEVTDWRVSHPWSLLPSVVLAVILIRKWRRS